MHSHYAAGAKRLAKRSSAPLTFVSTDGALAGKAYQMITPDSPTEDELKAFLENEKEKVKGKMVMVGKHRVIPVNFEPENKRMTDDQAKERFSGDGPAGPPTNIRAPEQQQQPGQPRKLSSRDVNQKTGEVCMGSANF